MYTESIEDSKAHYNTLLCEIITQTLPSEKDLFTNCQSFCVLGFLYTGSESYSPHYFFMCKM